MKVAFETLDRLRAVKNCPDVDEGAMTIMGPLWHGTLRHDDDPTRRNFLEYRKYERTTETHEGLPLFREVSERLALPLAPRKAKGGS